MNTTAIDTFNQIDAIRLAIHEALITALDNHDFALVRQLEKMEEVNSKVWYDKLETAYPTPKKVGA